MISPRSAIVAVSLLGELGTTACQRRDAGDDRVAATLQAGPSVSSSAPQALQRQLASAESVYFRGEYDSARTRYSSVAAAAASAGDTLSRARALTGLGLTAWRLGQYADARRLGEEALTLKVRGRLDAELPASYRALGLLAHNEGRFNDALLAFIKAERTARAVHDSAGVAKALGNAGLVYNDIGDFTRAASSLELMRNAAHDAGDRRTEANALNNLGMVSVRSGDPVRALAPLSAALATYREIDFPAGQENALGQLGTAHQAMGDPQLALAYYDSALAIARKHRLRQQEADDLGLIAELFDEAGDHARALEYLARAESVNRALGMLSEAGDIARAQSSAYAALGRLDLALARIRAARQSHDSAGAMFERLRDELFEVQLALDAGQSAQVAAALATARKTAAALGHGPARAELALGEARVYEASGDARRALRVFDVARRDLARLGGDRAWEADALEARALGRVGRLDEAVTSGRRALATVERVRAGFTSGVHRSSYASDRARVYADLALVLLRLDRADEAFQVADAARGRALLEHIAAVARNVRAEAPRDLREADQLLRRIAALTERLQAADRTPPRERSAAVETPLSNMLADARRQYEHLMQRIAGMDPSDAQVLGARKASGAAVRKALAPGEALVEYLIGSDSLVIFVVTRATTRSFVAPLSTDDLASRIRLARDLAATTAQDAHARATLSSLYETLIAPLRRGATFDGITRLIIVPSGALAYLPFSALIDARSQRYLVEDYAILMAPSASALIALRSASRTRNASVAAFAPFPDDLPATPEESRVAVQTSGAGRSFVGHAASERAARAALEGSAIVHFATHGMFNIRNPMFSRVDLAPGDRGGVSSGDGRLEVHELLSLDIRSPLVFLSGCETGVGGEWSTAFRRGEDYVTLSQAFLFAGARNVVGTLWRIDDRGAAAFAASFYRALARQDPVDALASAQRAMLHGAYRSPYYWSGYTLNGSGLLGSGAAQKGVASAVKLRTLPL